jgi:hypothetical protein
MMGLILVGVQGLSTVPVGAYVLLGGLIFGPDAVVKLARRNGNGSR